MHAPVREKNHTVAIIPIAFDLAWEKGKVVVGPGTQAACDLAIRIAQETKGSYILLTAAVPPEGYGKTPMAVIMMNYILETQPDLEVRVKFADQFRTLGEVLAVTDQLNESYVKKCEVVDKVIFAVKDFHLRRLRMISRYVFNWRNLPYRLEYETYDSNLPFWRRVYFVLMYEPIAFIVNWFRVQKLISKDLGFMDAFRMCVQPT